LSLVYGNSPKIFWLKRGNKPGRYVSDLLFNYPVNQHKRSVNGTFALNYLPHRIATV